MIMRNCNAVFSRSVAIRLFVVADADHYDPMLVCCQGQPTVRPVGHAYSRATLQDCN